MNEVSKEVRFFSFDVRPVFNIYEDLNQFYSFVTPERILNMYDIKVKERVKELEETYPTIEQGYPWGNLNQIDENELLLINDYIGMRPVLFRNELVDILESYHFMYMTEDGKFKNMPFKGVW